MGGLCCRVRRGFQKFFVFALPAVPYAVLIRRPRILRPSHAAIFVVAALFGSSLGFDTPLSLYRAVMTGTGNPVEFSRIRGALIYLVQFPAIFSLPLLLLAIAGTVDSSAVSWLRIPFADDMCSSYSDRYRLSVSRSSSSSSTTFRAIGCG